jgi:hypothetical protein
VEVLWFGARTKLPCCTRHSSFLGVLVHWGLV